jgi:DNA-binding PadR family transcriptional regulator
MFWNHHRRGCGPQAFDQHRGHHHDHHHDHGDPRFDFEAQRHGHGPRGRGGPWGGPPPWARQRLRDWADAFGGEPPRADRGAVRYLVLDAIADAPRHGYEIIQVIEQRSSGSYKPSPGVVYPTLQMLEDMGHTRASEEGGRKSYTITDAGKQDLAANREVIEDFYERTGENPWERFAEDFGHIRERIGLLMRTFKRAMRRGQLSSAALTQVVAVLDEAIRKIEAIFKDGKDASPRDEE